MARVSLRDSNEDIIRLVAGENPRAKEIIKEMMDVTKVSQRMLRGADSRAISVAMAYGEEPPARRGTFFSLMMLYALKESDLTAEQLITLHDKVCHGNPSQTAALAVNAFASRAPHLRESVRKAELGQPDHYDPAAILAKLNDQYGFFGRKDPAAVVPAASPARAMAELAAAVEEKITVVAPGGPTKDWALAIETGSPARPDMGPPAPWQQRMPARGEQHAHA